MPRYDYRCRSCDRAFDVRMSMSEYSSELTPACPECGSDDTARTFGSVGVMTGGGSSGSGGGSSCAPGGLSGFT